MAGFMKMQNGDLVALEDLGRVGIAASTEGERIYFHRFSTGKDQTAILLSSISGVKKKPSGADLARALLKAKDEASKTGVTIDPEFVDAAGELSP